MVRIGRLTCVFPLVVILCLSPCGHAFDRPQVFGIGLASGGWVLLDPPGYDERVWEIAAQAGSTSTRMGASWPDIQPNPDEWHWQGPDADIARCEQYGIEPYCLIVNTPWWASPTGETTHAYPPRDDRAAEFELFCTTLASRYAGRIKYYEFWNEQNGYGWHTDGGFNRADEYVPWLRRAYYALKAGDPDCEVGIGGLDDADGHGAYYVELVYYYRDLWYPGEKIFDAVADHPYSKDGNVSSIRWKLRNIWNVLVAHGDSDVTLWLTEYGWNTSGEATEEEQALYLTQSFDILTEPEFHYVTSAQYLAIADFETRYTGFGLSDVQLRPRPAYYAFQAYPRSDAPQISRVKSEPLSLTRSRITWETNIASTSRVEYGTSTAYGSTTPLEPALVTSHSVTLNALPPGEEIHYRAHSTAPGVPDASSANFRFYQVGNTVLNGDFEEGFQAGYPFRWFTDGTGFSFDGGIFNEPPDLVTVRSGDHSGCLAVNGGWGRPMDGVLWTSVAVPTGSTYTIRAWTMVDSHLSAPTGNMQARVGTDPTGGRDFRDPSVLWSSWNDEEEVWHEQTVTATAGNHVVTVFVHGQTVILANRLYFFYADDVTIEVTPSGPTATSTPTGTVTPTNTVSPTPTITPTPPVAPSPSVTPTPSIEPTPSITPTMGPCGLLFNCDFEEGFELAPPQFQDDPAHPRYKAIGWNLWGGNWWKANGLNDDVFHGGAYCQSVGTNWWRLDNALYQQVTVSPGVDYVFSAWTMVDAVSPGNTYLWRKIGVDPTGGINPEAPSVVYTSADWEQDVWTYSTIEFTASSPTATVFFRAKTEVVDEWEWAFVDDVALFPALSSQLFILY